MTRYLLGCLTALHLLSGSVPAGAEEPPLLPSALDTVVKNSITSLTVPWKPYAISSDASCLSYARTAAHSYFAEDIGGVTYLTAAGTIDPKNGLLLIYINGLPVPAARIDDIRDLTALKEGEAGRSIMVIHNRLSREVSAYSAAGTALTQRVGNPMSENQPISFSECRALVTTRPALSKQEIAGLMAN